MPDVLFGLPAISSIWFLFKTLLLIIILIIGVLFTFWFSCFLCFGLLLLLLQLLKLNLLGLIVINLFDSGLVFLYLLSFFLGCIQLLLLLLDKLLSLSVLLEKNHMLIHLSLDSFDGALFLGEEISLSSHKGEEVVIEGINTLALLNGGNKQAIKFLIVLHFEIN
jgi:hypothetical protein